MIKKIMLSLVLFTIFFFSHAINTKAAGWGYKKNPDHTPPDIGHYKSLIDGTSSFYVGNTTEKVVYLTFDAGYDNGELNKILDTLKEKQVIGSFFLTGDFINRFQDLTCRLSNDGHVVCNHSYGHKKIQNLTKDMLKEDLEKLENAYYKLTGKNMVKYFRPPEGEFSKEALKNVQELGYKTVFWSIAHVDWDVNNQPSNELTVSSIIDNLHNGAIILLHTVSTSNSNSLGEIIDRIKDLGYTFKTVLDL